MEIIQTFSSVGVTLQTSFFFVVIAVLSISHLRRSAVVGDRDGGAKSTQSSAAITKTNDGEEGSFEVLPCLKKRRSIFPRSYVKRDVEEKVVQSLLDAAALAPYHGSVPPWRFVVLGRSAMEQMQRLTLEYYDSNWRTVGWADGKHGTEEAYQQWREMTEGEIKGRCECCEGTRSYSMCVMYDDANSLRQGDQFPS